MLDRKAAGAICGGSPARHRTSTTTRDGRRRGCSASPATSTGLKTPHRQTRRLPPSATPRWNGSAGSPGAALARVREPGGGSLRSDMSLPLCSPRAPIRARASTSCCGAWMRHPPQIEHARPAAGTSPTARTIVAAPLRGRRGHGRRPAGHRGSSIAHRAMDKVYPADRHSGVAIAGAAGFALEMVRLFQLQLEHYEKVEGIALSLEGKANQLAQMVRQNLPSAMQGLAVVPLFAGYDLRRQAGAHLHLRRHRRTLRGERLPRRRLGRPRRPHHR